MCVTCGQHRDTWAQSRAGGTCCGLAKVSPAVQGHSGCAQGSGSREFLEGTAECIAEGLGGVQSKHFDLRCRE